MFRKLPPVPGTNSNYNTIDRIKKGNLTFFLVYACPPKIQGYTAKDFFFFSGLFYIM